MSNLFKDSNIKNVTLEEYGAMQKILKSDRGALLAKELLCQMSEMDENAPPYFLGVIPTISQIQANKYKTRISTMRGSMFALGRRLSADTIKAGEHKGTPRFLTKKFLEGTQLCVWEVLEYVQEFTNFQNFTREVKLGTRSDLPTASRICQCDELMRTYLLRFCKFLDDLETHDRKDLVCEEIFEQNPYLWDIVEWHRKHRKEWDDISPKKAKVKKLQTKD